mmetsp:Transcript_19622/g.36709  ORF Transcript_19622/g.36709 Transcript_19622/m.36709 type:complete len:201 (+) Transcript_19622:3910-4512(+)
MQRMPMRIPVLHQHPSMLARVLHAHSPPRILLQQPHHQIPRLLTDAAPPILVEHHPRTGHRIEPRAHIKRRRPTEQYEQHHANRPTINLLPVPPIPLHRMPPPQHLRCKILRSPTESLQPLRRHILRQSEIRQLDVHIAPPIDHQYVLRFQIPMHDPPFLVEVVYRRQYPPKQSSRLHFGISFTLHDAIEQISALDQFHD